MRPRMAPFQSYKLLTKDEILDQQSATRPKKATKGAYPQQEQVEHSGVIPNCLAVAFGMLLILRTASILARHSPGKMSGRKRIKYLN